MSNSSNNSTPAGAIKPPTHVSIKDIISSKEFNDIKKIYDKNNDGKLDDDEIIALIKDYNEGTLSQDLQEIISRFDTNKNGHIDLNEIDHLRHVFHLQATDLRYAGYTASLARLFRYLAFTSDFGEALRPVIHSHLVTATYMIAFGYCVADVGIEAYQLHKNNYIHPEKDIHMSMTQCIVERSTFQAFASLALPAVIIHQSVHFSKKMFQKIGRFTKWGPSVVGLSIIPFMPVYLGKKSMNESFILFILIFFIIFLLLLFQIILLNMWLIYFLRNMDHGQDILTNITIITKNILRPNKWLINEIKNDIFFIDF